MKTPFRVDAIRGFLVIAASFVPLAFGQSTAHTVPGAVSIATPLGAPDPAMQMGVTVWLKMHNKPQFDQTVEDLYNPSSPRFHHWLTPSDLNKYAPTDADIRVVRHELEAHGLTITYVDANRFLIRARGTVSSVESTFHTRLQNFRKDGQTFYANATEASLTGPAASLIEAISGLDNLGKKPMIKRRIDLRSGKPSAGIPLTTVRNVGPISTFFTTNCFGTAPETFVVPTNTTGLPQATYTGNRYDPEVFRDCGYAASDMQKVYGLDKVYQQGLRGEGQTIVIVDAFGSPTIQEDANAFSQLNDLPPLTTDNFQTIYPLGKPDPFQDTWIDETSLDVEWAHAIAPNAHIVLLVLPSDVEDQDFQFAIFYAAVHGLGSSISNSYGCFENNVSPATLHTYDLVISIAAALGISTNYASGDSGDTGLGKPIGEASTPSDSPHATSVGGTSLGIPDGNGAAVQVGWGTITNNLNFADILDDPPGPGEFFGGSGGGESVVFPKPAYQRNLPGRGRQQPDIAAVGDPFTGGVFVWTPTGSQQQLSVIGGTSLSTPIFSAIWALANQRAGHLLGNAAPAIAHMSPSAVLDVVPIASPTNPGGVIIDANGSTSYSAADLLAPELHTPDFYSALCSFADGAVLDVISFGTDTSLMVTKGWDNVTGFGTPNGMEFIEAAAGIGKQSP